MISASRWAATEKARHEHAAGIVPHRRVDQGVEFAEGDDLVEVPLGPASRHAEDRATHEDILTTRQVRMKSGANFQQGSHSDRISRP
jgi:hypothetical protein